MDTNLIIVIILLGAQLGLRFLVKQQATSNKQQATYGKCLSFVSGHLSLIFKFLFWSSVIVIVIVQSYWMREQFLAWYSAGPPASYLVPPYSGFGYFAQYSFTNFLMSPFLAFAAAFFVLTSAKFLNRRFQNRFFEDEEPYIAASALFLSGYPGWLYVIISVLALSFLLSTFYFLLSRRKERIPLYWLWLPLSISVILISNL